MHDVSQPHILPEPSQLTESLDWALTVDLGAVVLLFDDLGHVGMAGHPEAAGKVTGLDHQPL
jgi:hypothetical protein